MKLSITLSRKNSVCLLVAASILCFAAPIWAADGEVSATGGVNTMDGGVGTHGLYGGNAGFRFDGRVYVFGEGNWAQLASVTEQSSSSGTNITANGAVDLASFGGGFDYSFGSSRRIVPYIVTAAGIGHFYAKGSGSGGGVSATVSFPVTNDAYYGFGGGARIFFGPKWGIKPEFRYQRYQGSLLTVNSYISTVSLFFRFGD